MQTSDYQTAIDNIKQQEEKEQATFEKKNESYYKHQKARTDSTAQHASRLDSNHIGNQMLLSPKVVFGFACKDWNDKLDDEEMMTKCEKIQDYLQRTSGRDLLAKDTLKSLKTFLNNTFSERIKEHIITLVVDTKTIEEACRHCFGLYGVFSQCSAVTISMSPWHTLSNLIGEAQVFEAFLERAWHLNPTSPAFPERYRPLADALRTAHLDEKERAAAPLADPYLQLQELNDTAKIIKHYIQHAENASEVAKLANTQVKVIGAMYVINRNLEQKHEKAIQEARRQALATTPTEFIDTEEV